MSYSHDIISKKQLRLCYFFFGKLANVLLRNFYYNALGAFFDALTSVTLHVMTEMHFYFGKKCHAWSCQNVCDALTFLLDNIFIRFGTKLYRQVVGIPMGTNCAPLVADLFLFCYERDFMMSLSDDKQADIIDAFNTTSRYLDDICNINTVYFDHMVCQIYPSELQLNKANTSDTEAAFSTCICLFLMI